jgi:hypothetical protein
MAPYLRAVPVAQYRNLFSSSSVALLRVAVDLDSFLRDVPWPRGFESDRLLDSDLLITVPIKIGLFFKEAEEHGGGKS